MSLPTLSPLESLPNELLDYIISSVAASPPSLTRLQQPPSHRIAKNSTRDLKNLSLVSSGLCMLVRPRLFTHACFGLRNEHAFLDFVAQSDLKRHVTSIVVKGDDSPENREDPYWWRRVLCELDPLRITVVAPPSFIGAMLGTQIQEGHSWAFEIPFQVLHLGRDTRQDGSVRLEEHSSLLSSRDWQSLEFNEASSLKAYHHYEYFLLRVPSVFDQWGTLAHPPDRPADLPSTLSLNRLTTFSYTAVFPFYNHVNLVLDAVFLMTSLESLTTQLAPCQNDRVIEIEQRGSIDPSDPWMELATAYTLIAHAVKQLGDSGCLRRFQARDFQFEALRPELSSILDERFYDSPWAYDEEGVWNKVDGCRSISGQEQTGRRSS